MIDIALATSDHFAGSCSSWQDRAKENNALVPRNQPKGVTDASTLAMKSRSSTTTSTANLEGTIASPLDSKSPTIRSTIARRAGQFTPY